MIAAGEETKKNKDSVKKQIISKIHMLLPLLGMESFAEYLKNDKKICDYSFFLGFISYVLEKIEVPLSLPRSDVLNDDDVKEGYAMSKKEIENSKIKISDEDFEEIKQIVDNISQLFSKLKRVKKTSESDACADTINIDKNHIKN